VRLTEDKNPGAYAVSVQCLRCGKMLRLADARIDLDGPAFRAYYHEECAREEQNERLVEGLRAMAEERLAGKSESPVDPEEPYPDPPKWEPDPDEWWNGPRD
jgi:hypothetical protein